MAKDEAAPAGAEDPKKDPNSELYEGAGPKKIIRLVTVVAYMCSVSFVGVALSAYYLILWEPPNPRLIHRTYHLSAEPEAESLMSHEPFDSNDSPDTEYLPNNLLRDAPNGGNHDNRSEGSMEGWRSKNKLSHHDNDDNRAKINESLSELRNSLIDILRRNRTSNESTHLTASDETNKNKRVNVEVNDAPPTVVDIPLRTISGSESRDRFGRTSLESFPSMKHLEDNSVSAEYDETAFKPLKKKKFRRREAPHNGNPVKFDNPSMLGKKMLLHAKMEEQEEQSEFPPGRQASSSPKLISIAITSGETQIDTVTRSSTEEENSGGEFTTETQKEELTTMTESLLLKRIYSTIATDSDEDFTNSTMDTMNNTTDQSRVFSTE